MPQGGSRIDPRSRFLEGPADPELGVVCFRTDADRIAAMLVSFTCHPVNLYPSRIVSADWPGAVASELSRRHGPGCVVLVLNGPCGNVNPNDPYDPAFERGEESLTRMGRLLSEAADRVVASLVYGQETALDWRTDHLLLAQREPDPDELARARAQLVRQPRPAWTNPERTKVDPDWVYAAALADLAAQRARRPHYDYEVQSFRVGDAAFVGVPGEPFVEAALRIKLGSPTFPTYVVHNTKFAGYVPTGQAFERGGYETRTANWSRFEPGALDRIVERATASLRELFDRPGPDTPPAG
jgi:hypothetical protein